MHPARRHFLTPSDFPIFDTRLSARDVIIPSYNIREISVTTIRASTRFFFKSIMRKDIYYYLVDISKKT